MKLFKILTPVVIILISFSTQAQIQPDYGSADKYEQIRSELWAHGVMGGPDYRDAVELLAYLRESHDEYLESGDLWPFSYPEELVYPIEVLNLL